MTIHTPRLTLRPIQHGDEIILEEMSRDGSFSELGLDSDCAEWIGEWIDEAISLAEQDNPRVDYICWIVCLKDDGKVIGTVGNTYYEDTGKIGITYGIGAEYRQKGFAAEAVKAYLDFFFDHYGEDEIIATVLDENVSSCKTAEKAGFDLLDVCMYQDIYDDEPRLYHFYSARKK